MVSSTTPQRPSGGSSPARRASLWLWLALGLLACVGTLGYGSTRLLAETVGWVERTHEVRETLITMRSALAEAESSRRGYALSGDEAEVEVFRAAIERLRAQRRALGKLIRDNPAQLRRLGELGPLLERRAAMLGEAVSSRAAEGLDSREEVRRTRQGAEVTGQVLAILDVMAAEEERLLALRQRERGSDLALTGAVEVFGALLGGALLSIVFGRLRHEIDLRERSERAAWRSEENLAMTLHSIGDGVISTDAEGRVVRMNPVAQKLTGWDLAEAVGRSHAEVFRVVNEKNHASTRTPLEQVLRDGVAVGPENHSALVARGGVERVIADSAAPIRDSEGRLSGAVLVFRDMTAARAADERLRATTAFLDSVVEHLPSMVFVKDAASLRYTRFNRAAEELLGRTRAEMIGRTDLELFSEEQAQFSLSKDREALASRAVVDVSAQSVDTPRGARWLHTKKIPVLGEDGQPEYLVGISEDVTARKANADALVRAHDELERRVLERTRDLQKANEDLQREIGERKQAEAALSASRLQLQHAQKMEAVGRLAGGIAHDFNNVLSVILSYSSMLCEGLAPGDTVRADLEEIHRAGERAADLTRQLLAFSRQQVLSPQLLSLETVIAGMDKMLRRVIGEDVELRTVCAPGMPRVKVDPGQIEQVVMNLAVNARDAMPRGGKLTVETASVVLDEAYAAAHAGVRPGAYVLLAISDTGVGMDQATLAQIFEPFFTTKEVGKGTGLGLSTVFGIVQQSGGHVWVDSEPGKGTSFKIYLPAVHELPAARSARRSMSPAPLGSETILLAEDEEPVRVLARAILVRCGYQVMDAKNAAEARLLCERFSGAIHLLLSDVVMPQMSGRELAEQLAVSRPGMKILLMSGYTDDAVVRHGVREAGVAFLQKPITPENLAKKVREVLDGG